MSRTKRKAKIKECKDKKANDIILFQNNNKCNTNRDSTHRTLKLTKDSCLK